MRRDRIYLKSKFMNGCIPTEEDFHDLIDSYFNHIEDAFENFGLTTYDPLRTYNKNDTCIFNNQIWICNQNNVSGPFHKEKWEYLTNMPKIYFFPEWQPYTTYNQYDIVRWKNGIYYSRQNSNIGNIPTMSEYWAPTFCFEENIINWMPAVYHYNQYVIINDNLYRVAYEGYFLSLNAENDINRELFVPVLRRKYVATFYPIIETPAIDYSNNYLIKIDNLRNFSNGDLIVLKSSTNKYYEVSIYSKVSDYEWKIKEALHETNLLNLYSSSIQHNIIAVNQGKKQFTISGTVNIDFGFIQVKNSTRNNGFYTIVSVTYQNNNTIIEVNQTIPSSIADGVILRYTSSSQVTKVDKLDNCILKINKNENISYKPNKLLMYKNATYVLMDLYESELYQELVIEPSSLSGPLGNVIIGSTVQINHNLKSTTFVWDIYNNSENRNVIKDLFNITIINDTTVEIDLLIPELWNIKPVEHQMVIII